MALQHVRRARMFHYTALHSRESELMLVWTHPGRRRHNDDALPRLGKLVEVTPFVKVIDDNTKASTP